VLTCLVIRLQKRLKLKAFWAGRMQACSVCRVGSSQHVETIHMLSTHRKHVMCSVL
jgi:hypothetical protein